MNSVSAVSVAGSAVFNCADLKKEILSLTYNAMPTVCKHCQKSEKLYLHKFYEYCAPTNCVNGINIGGRMPTNEEIFSGADITIITYDRKMEQWLCSKCWHNQISKEWFVEKIQQEYPEWDRAKVKREERLIRKGDRLFKNHKNKLLQEKVQTMEKLAYKSMAYEYMTDENEAINFNRQGFQQLKKYVYSVRQTAKRRQTSKFIKELLMKKLIKHYLAKQISYNIYEKMVKNLITFCPRDWNDLITDSSLPDVVHTL